MNSYYFAERKVLRRFIWHDRIHAKAMWKMAKKTFGENADDILDWYDGMKNTVPKWCSK